MFNNTASTTTYSSIVARNLKGSVPVKAPRFKGMTYRHQTSSGVNYLVADRYNIDVDGNCLWICVGCQEVNEIYRDEHIRSYDCQCVWAPPTSAPIKVKAGRGLMTYYECCNYYPCACTYRER